jgi:hypothetical protein
VSKLFKIILDWNVIVQDVDIPAQVEDQANPKNPEFVKLLQKIRKNSSTVYSILEGIK